MRVADCRAVPMSFLQGVSVQAPLSAAVRSYDDLVDSPFYRYHL